MRHEDYERDGVVCLRGLFSKDWLPKFRRFALESPAARIAGEVMGDDARYCLRKGELAIPTQDPGLAHGARLDSERFPLAWKGESAHG